MNFTLQERIFLLERYLATNSYRETIDAFVFKFPDTRAPNKSTISRILARFRETGSVADRQKRRKCTVLTPAKVEEIGNAFSTSPHCSLRRVSQQTGTSLKSTHRATKMLNLHPYRVSVLQELKVTDCRKRIEFCKWLLHLSRDNVGVFNNFFFSDEAWVQLDGYINSQNYRTWSTENPHMYREMGLHPPKLGIWCAISRKRIVGPIFFTRIITSEIYQGIITQFIALLDQEERDCLFQQDGARPHTSHETMEFLREFFGDRVISTGLWPPRSPDLSPCDFFLWGYLKDRIFRTVVRNIEELKQRITEEIAKITPQMLHRVFRNLLKRAVVCKNNLGTQFQHFL